jgi:hypothetical protein
VSLVCGVASSLDRGRAFAVSMVVQLMGLVGRKERKEKEDWDEEGVEEETRASGLLISPC